ncbi:phage protein [Peribacillus sp. B-H-3]|uniref:phage protein n=1 Tax=Peribacillus sp. B-H-3 TaxID=3400420 RepID=UPI003B01968F
MSSNLLSRVIKVSVKGNNSTTFTNDDLEIQFEVPFDDDAKPNESLIEIYNLSDDSIHRMARADTCTVQSGSKTDYGVLSIGKISRILTRREGVDKITAIYSLEGEDFSRIKVTAKTADPAKKGKKQTLHISFKAGTHASTIIKKLCSILGIKLALMKLPKDVVYKKGYNVTGQILNNLEDVVKDCGAVMYHRRGSLFIRSLKEGNDESFTLNELTGLIGSPEPFEEDGVKGFKVKALLQHRITTASIITIKSKTANGKYRVRKGTHSFNGSEYLTEIEVI